MNQQPPQPQRELEDAHRPSNTVANVSTISIMTIINTAMMMMVGVAALIDTPRVLTSLPRGIIDDIVQESMNEIELPQPKSNKRRRKRNRNDNTKRKLNSYDRKRALDSVMADYLGPVPTFEDHQFERFFRLTRERVEFILSNLAHHDPYWTQTYDCCGKPSIAPAVKFLAVQKMLCYGVSFSAFQDYFQMGDSTVREFVSRMTMGIV